MPLASTQRSPDAAPRPEKFLVPARHKSISQRRRLQPGPRRGGWTDDTAMIGREGMADFPGLPQHRSDADADHRAHPADGVRLRAQVLREELERSADLLRSCSGTRRS